MSITLCRDFRSEEKKRLKKRRMNVQEEENNDAHSKPNKNF